MHDRSSAWITPARTVFVGSLILSLLAALTSPAINRDGMLYVEAARSFQLEGFDAAKAVFNWPFLPILMALLSSLSGLSLEHSGLVLNAFLLAGAFALMANCAHRKFPEAIWPICLTLLALPGLNHYRDELLREYGCWFFVMLSFWLATRWSERTRWSTALAAQFALGFATLFRPEAAAFFAALFLWQLFAPNTKEKLHRLIVIGALPLFGMASILFLFLSGQLESGSRIAGEFGRISAARFDAKALALADALIPYARDQAKTILFFGSIAIIPLKFIKQLGVFLIPLLLLACSPLLRSALNRWQLFSWSFIIHLVVLSVFVLDIQFLAGRYVIVLHFLAAPLIGFGLWLLMQRIPKWKTLIVTVSLLLSLSNAASFSPKKTHAINAGAWLSANAKDSPRVYMESSLAGHYAGWRLRREAPLINRSELSTLVAQEKYDLLVFEITPQEPDISPWLEQHGLRQIQRFGNSSGTQIVIASPEIR